MGKEAAMARFEVLSKNLHERTKGSQQNMTANISAEFRNEHPPNAMLLRSKAGITNNLLFQLYNKPEGRGIESR
jgi:hypothetical protein